MIRAIRPSAMAQDDAAMILGWNVAPNVAYTLRLLPGPASCGVLLYDDDGSTLIAAGAALVGTEQPCTLIQQAGQTVGMVDADLGWHLLLTTTGTESQRTIRIGPAVDLPDEIHPVYGDDALALARATAAVDAAAHYVDDITVTCPLGLGAGLGDVVSVPVDGAAVVGQVESITWTGTPDGAIDQAVIRRHVAIAPESFVEADLPTVEDDTASCTNLAGISGNVFANDDTGLTIVAVNGFSSNVGVALEGNNGGSFTVNADGSWVFDPDGDFATLGILDTEETSVTYYASNGTTESMATLTVTVSRANVAPVAVDDEGTVAANATTSGNVLTNDTDADDDQLVVSKVGGSASNVGVAVAGSNGGLFTINSNGSWEFNPDGDFADLAGDQTATTTITYNVSDGALEDEGTVSVTVTAASGIMFVASAVGGVNKGGVNPITMTIPTETQPGDLVLVVHGMKRITDYPVGVTDPTDYTEIADLYANDSNDTNLSVSYKIMGDPVDSSVTVNASGHAAYANAALLQVWRNVDPSTPIDVTTTTATGINGTNANPPAITPVTPGAIVLSVIGVTSNNPCTLTPPGSPDYTTMRGVDGDGDAINLGVAGYAWGSGELDLGVWTYSGASVPTASDSWCAATVALRPA